MNRTKDEDEALRRGLFRWWDPLEREMCVGTFSEIMTARMAEREHWQQAIAEASDDRRRRHAERHLAALDRHIRDTTVRQAAFVDRGRKSALAGVAQSRKPRVRLTVLEKWTGLADKKKAAAEVRRRLLRAIKKMQEVEGLRSDQRPWNWAARLAKVFSKELGVRITDERIHDALPVKHRPWRPV